MTQIRDAQTHTHTHTHTHTRRSDPTVPEYENHPSFHTEAEPTQETLVAVPIPIPESGVLRKSVRRPDSIGTPVSE